MNLPNTDISSGQKHKNIFIRFWCKWRLRLNHFRFYWPLTPQTQIDIPLKCMRSLAFCRKMGDYLPNHGREMNNDKICEDNTTQNISLPIWPDLPKLAKTFVISLKKKPFPGVRSPWWQTMKLQCIITQQSGRKAWKSGGGGRRRFCFYSCQKLGVGWRLPPLTPSSEGPAKPAKSPKIWWE